MRKIRAVQVTLSQAAGASAGTATTTEPLNGEVIEVRMPAAGSTLADGTADFTITRVEDGGTVLALSNQTAPWEYHPRRAVHSDAGGTTAYGTGLSVYDTGGGIPVDGYVQTVWAQGATAVASVPLWFFIREA